MRAADRYFHACRTAPDEQNFLTILTKDGREDINWGKFRTLTAHRAGLMLDAVVGAGDIALIFYPHQRHLLPAFFVAQLIGALPSYMPALSPRQDLALFRSRHGVLIDSIKPALICGDDATAAALPDLDRAHGTYGVAHRRYPQNTSCSWNWAHTLSSGYAGPDQEPFMNDLKLIYDPFGDHDL